MTIHQDDENIEPSLAGAAREGAGRMVTPDARPTEAPPNPELLRSLGRLVRGLSALFWGLPAALVVCVSTGVVKTGMEVLDTFGILPPIVGTGWLLYGLWQLGHFQKQERVWISALDRAKWFALINLGLSPFLFWWSRRPDQPFFNVAVEILAVCALVFLGNLNLVLYRLSAMLPDENLRDETRHFTTVNRLMVLGLLVLGILFGLVLRYPELAPVLGRHAALIGSSGVWALLFLVLLPVAITMALIWKIKEVILSSVFGA